MNAATNSSLFVNPLDRAATVDEQTVDLLRAEVAQLEQELADRDARLAELSGLVSSGDASGVAGEEPPDTVALVSRLEQLLDELERKDAREASLEGMLRAAEDANRAEQEERRQIETWLGEIESRVGQREAEWRAATEALQRQAQEVTAERDRAEQALKRRASGTPVAEPPQELIDPLRQQIADLQLKLLDSEQSIRSLREQVAHAEPVAKGESHKEEVEKLLRAERLQVAHEQAELARQRAALELERRGMTRVPDEVDRRVQALREHLREIHEREVQEQKERQQHSLSARIANLWKRLDGSA